MTLRSFFVCSGGQCFYSHCCLFSHSIWWIYIKQQTDYGYTFQWRNGSVSDSGSEGYGFKSHLGRNFLFWFICANNINYTIDSRLYQKFQRHWKKKAFCFFLHIWKGLTIGKIKREKQVMATTTAKVISFNMMTACQIPTVLFPIVSIRLLM